LFVRGGGRWSGGTGGTGRGGRGRGLTKKGKECQCRCRLIVTKRRPFVRRCPFEELLKGGRPGEKRQKKTLGTSKRKKLQGKGEGDGKPEGPRRSKKSGAISSTRNPLQQKKRGKGRSSRESNEAKGAGGRPSGGQRGGSDMEK